MCSLHWDCVHAFPMQVVCDFEKCGIAGGSVLLMKIGKLVLGAGISSWILFMTGYAQAHVLVDATESFP